MIRNSLSLSIASFIALAGTTPLSYAQEDIECDGVVVQSRFALANCMVESAAAIAAGIVSQQGCQTGEWDIAAVVPEFIEQTIPIQGFLTLSNASDAFTLTGQSSAQLQNNVNCQIATTEDINTFAGVPFTYSAGSDNFYIDAVVDRDESLLCITDALSASNITTEGGTQFQEADSLTFSEGATANEIEAAGVLSIVERSPTEGPGIPLSAWNIEETVVMPPEDETAVDGFQANFVTNDIGGCQIMVNADVENLRLPTSEVSGGLTIAGTLTVEAPVELPPVADPNGPYAGLVGEPITFDGTGSFDPDGGEIVSYAWDFGDGNTGTGPTPTHTYAEAGTYDVTLEVTDDEDTTGTEVTTATIGTADVFLTMMRVSRRISLNEGGTTSRQVLVLGGAEEIEQEATVTLSATADEGLNVTIQPEAVTETVVPEESTWFQFSASLSCEESGSFQVEWTATIAAEDNVDSTNDTITAVSQVNCR